MQAQWDGLSLAQLLTLVKQKAPDLDAYCPLGEGLHVFQFASLLEADDRQIAFLANTKYASQLAKSGAGAVVLSQTHYQSDGHTFKGPGLIVCSNPYAFFAFSSRILLEAQQSSDQQSAQTQSVIHSTAIIHPKAVIGERVLIGPYVTVDEGATIANDCRIDAHCVIGAHVAIGNGTHLNSHVTAYHGVQIGASCIIHSGAVIGSDGFGFAPYQKRWIKIPQTGTVRIGDDVEIGSNCSIDRGALGDTVIGRGTKLDNLIQIAHNVQVGEDCAFAANIAIAGSATIGNRVQMGGKAGVLGHLSVCDDVVISSCTLVTKTIAKPGFYSGVYPFQDNAEWEKNAVSLKRLNTLREQVKALEKTVNLQLNDSAKFSAENSVEKSS
jgi:UDP-3-O-[3-hydroxymyristoyl] glucosamine N-acyltransferase